jgi:hypothetical protein
MSKLKLIAGTEAPDTIKEQVRKRLRKTRTHGIPQCPHCASRTYIEVKTGTLTQRACVFCLFDKRLVVME